MSWATAVLLLLACSVLGALAGFAPGRVRTRFLVLVLIVAAFLVFMPGQCVTGTASTPLGTPKQLSGQTSCETLYGAALPEVGAVQADAVGTLLGIIAAGAAATALLVVRRRRSSEASPREAGGSPHAFPSS